MKEAFSKKLKKRNNTIRECSGQCDGKRKEKRE